MLKEGDVVNIFEFTGKVRPGATGYYVTFSDPYEWAPHMNACIQIARHFNPTYEDLSDLIHLDKDFKTFCDRDVTLSCIFPEFKHLSDLEEFINALTKGMINKSISIF